MYRKLDINNKTQYATAASQQWLNLRLQLLGVVISSSVAMLAVGLHYWSNQTIDAGLVGLALVYSLSVTGLLNGAVQSFAQTEMDMVSVERVMQYINNIEPEKSIENTNQQNMIIWPNNGIITFDSVSMRYRSDMPLALENVSFTVKSGEHIGIVGKISTIDCQQLSLKQK
jgi:ATP-binding cassette subfamily C (CFTR/MRP) protein 10